MFCCKWEIYRRLSVCMAALRKEESVLGSEQDPQRGDREDTRERERSWAYEREAGPTRLAGEGSEPLEESGRGLRGGKAETMDSSACEIL